MRLEESVRQVAINQNEQLTHADFQNMVNLPYTALKNALAAIFGGQSEKFYGLELEVKLSGGQWNVYVKPGFGVVTNATKDVIGGTYLLNNQDTTFLFPLPVTPKPPAPGDVGTETTIRVYLVFDQKLTNVEKRNFVQEDGGIITRDTPTIMEQTFTGNYEIVTGPTLIPYSQLTIGTIVVTGQVVTITNVADNPLTVHSHRSRNPIDHPDGSIHAKHLSAQLSGGYSEGYDLSLHAMSEYLNSLKGTMETPNARVSGVINENGEAVTGAIEVAANELVQSYMDNLTDGQGNLSKKAIDNLRDEMGRPAVYRIGVTCGQVSGNSGSMKVPEGFTLAETYFICSIATLGWKHVDGTGYVYLTCAEESPGICVCSAQVSSNYINLTTYGSANYLAIAIKPRA